MPQRSCGHRIGHAVAEAGETLTIDEPFLLTLDPGIARQVSCGACTERSRPEDESAADQGWLRAWAVNPSRKLQRFESSTRHWQERTASDQGKLWSGAVFVVGDVSGCGWRLG